MEKTDLISSSELAALLHVGVTAIHYNNRVGNLPKPISKSKNVGTEFLYSKIEVAQALGLDNLDEPFLTMDEAVKFLHMAPSNIKELCRNKFVPLPYYTLGGDIRTGSRYYFRQSELEAYLKQDKLGLIKQHPGGCRGRGNSNYKLNFLLNVLQRALENSNLSQRESEVLKMAMIDNQSLEEIGEKFNLSRERVRQILEKARHRLLRRLSATKNLEAIIQDLRLTNGSLTKTIKDLEGKLNLPPSLPPTSTDRLLATPIDELELSVRAHNCLKAANIKTLGELAQLQEYELLKFRNFGRKALNELSYLLEEHNLEFGMKID
jgi:RNA polymerase sigma factor (sigma-70 family)